MKNPQTIADMQLVAQDAFDRASEFKLPTITAFMLTAGVTAFGLYGVGVAGVAISTLLYTNMRGHKRRGQDIENAISITYGEVKQDLQRQKDRPYLPAGAIMEVREHKDIPKTPTMNDDILDRRTPPILDEVFESKKQK